MNIHLNNGKNSFLGSFLCAYTSLKQLLYIGKQNYYLFLQFSFQQENHIKPSSGNFAWQNFSVIINIRDRQIILYMERIVHTYTTKQHSG